MKVLNSNFNLADIVIENYTRQLLLQQIQAAHKVQIRLLTRFRDLLLRRRNGPIKIADHLVKPRDDYHQRQRLQYSPDDGNAGAIARTSILCCQRQHCTGHQPAEMRGIVNKPAAQVTNNQVDNDDRQHPYAERSLESFGQLASKLNAENKQHTYQAKQRA